MSDRHPHSKGYELRLSRIDFQGYKRLRNTGCNVDGQLMAFVGPNEAGKSSVLEGLAWLTDATSGELPSPLVSRTDSDDVDRNVVSATFILGEEERQMWSDLDVDQDENIVTRKFIRIRNRDGSRNWNLTPELRRNPTPRIHALRCLQDLYSLSEIPDEQRTATSNLISALTGSDELEWTEDLNADGDLLRGWLREEFDSDNEERSTPVRVPADLSAELEKLLSELITQLQSANPNDIIGNKLWERTPKFLLFGSEDRILRNSYDLMSEEVQNSPPSALDNILANAGTSVEEILRHISTGDQTRLRTLERNANKKLSAAITARWRQDELGVHLSISGTLLEVNIIESRDGGDVTAIGERSDGFRTFISLVSFLARQHSSVPPVLLIDEAETHLHYNAQADLLDFLLDSDVSQVIYTTHSPGCLPPDLGTGIRLVSIDSKSPATSKLLNNFWTTEEQGFTPLLFAMGASAAAFAACRYAVFTEGAADMILLPSLIRKATGERRLKYQVVPGLANIPPSDLGQTELTAGRVAYLVDGDKAGEDYTQKLLDAKIDKSRIFQLPKGTAPEDLLDRSFYLHKVNTILADRGENTKITESNLDLALPISSAVSAYLRDKSIDCPGKTAVASLLIRNPDELKLTKDGTQELISFHTKLVNIFELH